MAKEITIEEIYAKHKTNVLNYVNLKLKNLHDAEEVTEDIFLKVMRLLHTFDENKSAFPTWLRKITDCVIIDFTRTNHQDKYTAVSDFVNSDGDSSFQFACPEKPDAIMENQELRAKLLESFEKLKGDYKMVASLYFIKELRYEEIAEELEMKIGTVKAIISRSREMLKKDLNSIRQTKQKELV